MLTSEQIAEFDERGFLVLTNAFSEEEINAIAAEVGRLKELDHPQRMMEETDTSLVRALYAVEDRSELLRLLTRDARLAESSKELLRAEVYIHQTQVSPKEPLRSAVWEWHQDFLYWNRDDGMPTSNVLSAAIFLDEVTEFNGPMYVVAGSHRLDLDSRTATMGEGWEKTARSGNKYTVSQAALADVITTDNLISVKGGRGTVVFFHGGLLHCSPPNLSPWSRNVLFVRYNSIDNALRPVPNPRPEWLANRNPQVVKPLDASFLVAASSGLPG